MKTKDFYRLIKKETNIKISDIEKVLDSFRDNVAKHLMKGINVEITTLANFTIEENHRTDYRNPKTGEKVKRDKSYKLRVKAYTPLRQRIANKPFYDGNEDKIL